MARLILMLVLLLPFPAEISPDPNQPPSNEHQCLAYHPEVVQLSGTLELRKFASHAGSGGNPSVGGSESAWILRLLVPICTTGSGAVGRPESGVHEVQVVVPEEVFDALAAIAGHPVTVIGTLFHSHSGHHHTPVLIFLQDLSSGDPSEPGSLSRARAVLAQRAGAPPTTPIGIPS